MSHGPCIVQVIYLRKRKLNGRNEGQTLVIIGLLKRAQDVGDVSNTEILPFLKS